MKATIMHFCKALFCTPLFFSSPPDKSLSIRRPRIASYLMLMLCLTFGIHSHAQFVHTDGTRIVDKNGNDLYLNGMNLGNWLLWEGYLMMGDFNYRTHTQFLNSLAGALGGMENAREFEHQWRLNYVTEATIAELKGLGFNSVRVPFHYNMFWQNGQLSDHGFQYFDRLIEFCRIHEVYILLDMHAAPGYQNPGDHSDNMNSNASQPRGSVGFWDGNNVAIASQVWRHIANRYKDEPMIWGYDLINEPVTQEGRKYELLPSLIQMRNAIREVDNNHIIVAEGDWWGSDMESINWNNPATRAATGVTAKWDDNLVYQTHHYVFGNAGWIPDLYPRGDLTNSLGIPLILGEYGEDEPHILRTMTDWSINNIAGHFPWSFKKMSHARTLWTIQPNSIYNQVKNYINNGGTPPAGAYQGMINFAQNNIANGSPGLEWHQSFYDAVKPNVINNPPPPPPPPQTCTNASYHGIGVIQAEAYCAMNGVQTESTSDSGGGLNIGWLDVGDWVDYNINVPSAGTYTVNYRVASPENTGEIQLLSGGATLASRTIPNTGGWQNWTTVSSTAVLSGGQQTVRLYINGAPFNLNWFEISQGDSGNPGNGDSIANGTYKLVNAGTGKVLNVQSASTSNGGNVQLWSDTGANHQRWQVTSVNNGQYRIEALHSGLALDVAGVSAANGANIQQWAYGGGANQRWLIEPVGNGNYRVISVHSGKSLDVQDNSSVDGANIQQWDYHGGPNQLWKLQ